MLEIGKGKSSSLSTLVVCRGCGHVECQETPDIWVDSNNDTYYLGSDKESLAAFIFHHG
jgi:hypothetical protein